MVLNRYHTAALAAVGLMFALMIQSALNWPYQPRFVVSALNYWAVAATFLAVPVMGFWISRALPPRWERKLDLTTAIVLLFPCILVAICVLVAAPSLSNEEMPLIGEARSGWPVYRLYESNCGAACSIGLVLKEERPLLAGLKLVTPRWERYRVGEGHLELGPASVRIVHGQQVLGEVPR